MNHAHSSRSLDAATVQLGLLGEMAELTAEMADAAEAMAWERLFELSRHLRELQSHVSGDNAGLNTAALERKAELIRLILDNQARILRYAEPWLEDVRQLLGGPALQRKVKQAYFAGLSPLA